MKRKIDTDLLLQFDIEIPSGAKPVFDCLGLVDTDKENSLTFIDDIKYQAGLNLNKNITGVICTKDIAVGIDASKIKMVSSDPRFEFYSIQNKLFELNYEKIVSRIGQNCSIHPSAVISEYNVVIGSNVIIEPNVTILENTEIGDNVIVRAGTVIGAEGFEHKRTSKGILSVKHDGKVIIGNKVEIGANCAISKGFVYRNTLVGAETKLDNLVHVAHGVQIGERCFLPACCMIAGSTSIGDDVWVGPGVSVSSQVNIGSGSFLTIGSVVTRNLPDNSKVTGNFAVDHELFIRILKKNIQIASESGNN